MSPANNLRHRPSRRKTRSSTVTINALNDDDFFLIFDNFKLQNLFALRLVNHRWDALVQDKFRNRTELTVQVKGAPKSGLYNQRQHRFGQLFYVDNIEDVLTKRAANANRADPIESVGELISIQFQNVKSFSAILRRLLADNLQTLVVHWESADNRLVTLLTLVNACPNLTRLSLWTPDDLANSKTSKLTLVERLCKILPQQESLTWLDLNCYHDNYNHQISFKKLHLQQLLPQLERLSLCHFAKDPIGLLARAGQQLTHLKLDCVLPDFTSEQFHHLLTELNPSLATSITTFSLLSPTMSMLEVSSAFINLHTLKLQIMDEDNEHNEYQYYQRNIDYELLTTLGRMSNLRKLFLHGYHLLPTHPRPCSLPSVTSLTLTNTDMLFRNFTNEADPNRRGRRRVNVPAFCTALFAQFPALKELTLVGPVYQKENVRHRLDGALTPRLDKLNMFFNKFIDREHLFGGGRTKQTARKSTGGRTPRHVLAFLVARKSAPARAPHIS